MRSRWLESAQADFFSAGRDFGRRLVLVAAVLLASCAEAGSGSDALDVATPREGLAADALEAEAPAFSSFPTTTLTACDGTAIGLTGAAATWIVLTAGDCPACKDQLPFVAGVAPQWAPRGVRVVVVVGDDAEGSGHVSPAFCQAFRSDWGLPCPVARDDGFASLGGFAGSSTPVQLVLDADLAIRAVAAGWDEAFHPGWIAREIDAVLAAE
jgi:hypothetical protein